VGEKYLPMHLSPNFGYWERGISRFLPDSGEAINSPKKRTSEIA